MADQWIDTTWGQISTLHYGKSLKDYSQQPSSARVFGTNGPIGWYSSALVGGPGLVIGRKGAYRGVHYSTGPYWVIDTAYYLKAKVPLDLRWAYYALLDFDVNNIDDGSPIPSTTRDAFYFAPVKLPPFDQQQRIAALLDALDAKIELNQQMTVTLDETARALFQSWFIDFDPIYANSEGRASALPADIAGLFPDRFGDNGLPEGWRGAPLSSMAKFLNGLALQKFPVSEGDPYLPVVKIAELRVGPRANSTRASNLIPEQYIVNEGDHLFSWSGSLMHCIWQYEQGALNQHLFKVIPTTAPAWLCYYAVDHFLPDFQRIASAKAVTMGHIQREHLDGAVLSLPSDDTIAKLGTIMEPLFARNKAIGQQLRILAHLRDTLLPQLISGKLRIPTVAQEVAAA